ncbi:unnamed protein product [Brassicogethes aeneus]|uniref:Uncharacterized protein n=1 Tax=Brassicogethes aeneus TaxID=1431903 RepID=A0A9P0B0Q3_BRAAE|nr:unnamed protein product [Brassicogethes aeneus]
MEFVVGGMAATSAGPSDKQPGQIQRFLDAGCKVAKKDGLKSLQKGLSPALGAHLMSYGTKLGSYQFGQNRGLTTDRNGNVVLLKSISTSGAGGMLGTILIQSLLFTKNTKRQLVPQVNGRVYESFLDCVKKTYKANGFKPFYRGMGPIYLKLGPHTILCLDTLGRIESVQHIRCG